MTGGYGFCTGFGQAIMGSKLTKSPWYSAFASVHITFMASMRSRAILCRSLNGVPWSAISSAFQPEPTPNRNLPAETWSMEATSFAVWIGSRWLIRQTPVPTFSVVVVTAAAVSTRNGSMMS